MKVISYNLHKGRGRLQRDILTDAVHALRERKPDVLACQEVYHSAVEALGQCHFITEVLGHSHVFGPNAFYARGCHGNATFANLVVDGHLNIDATESMLERRGILRTWLRGAGETFEVLNVHFSLTRGQRRRQWHRLLQALPAEPDKRVIVCGDFNDWTGELDGLALRSTSLRNALWNLSPRQRRTFPNYRPLFPLDRVYLRGFDIHHVEVLQGSPWNRLSDHLPVEVIIGPR
jgi:endonuclease/exonuclease/phosphatase family metal-dependent hydrolase